MVTEIIKIDVSNPDSQIIKYAAGIIDNGGFVAFPTETVYGIACRVTTDSLAKLDQLKSRGAEKRYTLHIGRKTDIQKYVPRMRLIAEKLIKRAWPGPLTIVFELDRPELEIQYNHLGEAVCKFLYVDDTIGIRYPENLIAQNLLLNTSYPVVAPSANPSGTKPAVNVQEAVNYLDGQVNLILDGGSCKYGTNSSVVKIGKKGLEVLREGVYSKKQIYEMAKINILFVCTGNTCRSPMAQGLCKKYISEKYSCDVDQLEQIGYNINSAGVMAATGISVTDEAVKACQKKSVDIKTHHARPLSAEIVDKSDIIFVMSENHRFCVNAFGHEAEAKCFLLDKNGDIADPIGGGQDAYDRCCELIDKVIRERLSELNL